MQLDTTERRIMESRGSRHTLVIRKVHRSDFGNYTCVADNQLGKTRKSVQLTGMRDVWSFLFIERLIYDQFQVNRIRSNLIARQGVIGGTVTTLVGQLNLSVRSKSISYCLEDCLIPEVQMMDIRNPCTTKAWRSFLERYIAVIHKVVRVAKWNM